MDHRRKYSGGNVILFRNGITNKDISWLTSQIVYEIFPDRFAVGKRYRPEEKRALPCYERATDYAVRDWKERPNALTGTKEFFGGDLYGIIDRLDYLQDLGITTLYLTPIFFAPSNHKYDTTDFFEIDEQFGGREALAALIKALHQRGMYLFLDIAFNHISDIHPWFIAAVRNEQPYRNFFIPSADFLADEFLSPDDPDFSLHEFQSQSSLDALCKAVTTDYPVRQLPAPAKKVEWLKIDWLNNLLKDHRFYSELIASARLGKIKAEEKHSLDQLTVQYVQYNRTKDEEELKRLVRSLLEIAYPEETPKARNRFSVARLCRKIRADGLNISAEDKSISRLNALLRTPDLYEKVLLNRKGTELDPATQDTLEALKSKYSRTRREDDLAKLNRYVLESFYPQETPMSYQAWQGYRPMPELNLTDKELQRRLYRNDDSVLQQYLGLGVDGLRFDTANDLGPGTIEDIRQALKERFLHVVFVGELTSYAADWIDQERKYHGVMNYYLHGALSSWLSGTLSSLQMNHTVNEYYQGYGKQGALSSWNILSSHDTARLRNLLPEEKARTLALIAQFTLPGVPLIYYGEEIGMEGGPDPDCRRPMIWDETLWDKNIFALYKKLIAIRQERPELREGRFMMLGHKMVSDALAFLRYTEKINEVALVVLNRSRTPLQEKLFLPHSHLYQGLRLEDLLSPSRSFEIQSGGNIELNIPAQSATLLVPDDTACVNYNFYKERSLAAGTERIG